MDGCLTQTQRVWLIWMVLPLLFYVKTEKNKVCKTVSDQLLSVDTQYNSVFTSFLASKYSCVMYRYFPALQQPVWHARPTCQHHAVLILYDLVSLFCFSLILTPLRPERLQKLEGSSERACLSCFYQTCGHKIASYLSKDSLPKIFIIERCQMKWD